ncbi:MAG: hypothetical protein MAG453_02149 [Calditrichaeota bacterium]|nr:hypothetical protein [Calditrichota bacterium]
MTHRERRIGPALRVHDDTAHAGPKSIYSREFETGNKTGQPPGHPESEALGVPVNQESDAYKSEDRRAEHEPTPRPEEAFVVYDNNLQRGRQLQRTLFRMGFARVVCAGGPKRLIGELVNMLNQFSLQHPAIVTHVDAYPVVRAIMDSDEMEEIRNRLPGVDKTAIFVFHEYDRERNRLTGVDPRYVLNMKHSHPFNRTRISQVLRLLHSS